MAQPIVIEREVEVPMRDGINLLCDVYRPSGEGRYPVLLSRTPYDKTARVFSFAGGDPVRFAGAGYVVVSQDVRGTGTSEGEFYPFRAEAEDGFDSVEWCAAQPWSTGDVGMFGTSYVGACQWLTAALSPPHLRTIVPAMTTTDLHSWIYEGGAFRLLFALSWMPYLLLGRVVREGDDGFERFAAVERMIDELPLYAARLPLTDVESVVREWAPYYLDWLENPRPDDHYWRQLSSVDPADVSIPVFLIGGWHDVFCRGLLHDHDRMTQGGPTGVGHQLLVGPWNHADPWLGAAVGDLDYGVMASGPGVDVDALQLAWFDRLLKGAGDDLAGGPPVTYFVPGAKEWRSVGGWPPGGTRGEGLYLSHLDDHGLLTPDCPGREEPDRFTYDPAAPVPTCGGNLAVSPAFAVGGPVDQGEIEQRADVLVYTSPPLERPREVIGSEVRVELYAESNAPSTDWTAKLVDVHPDGRALCLADGILRVEGREAGAYLAIDLGPTCNVFGAGHRIRLEISSSNFPRLDRNLNTSRRGADSATLQVAEQQVFHDSARPSRLVLPVNDLQGWFFGDENDTEG